MGDNLYGSSIHDGIDVPKFHYYGIHTVGPYFDEGMFMTIGKTGMRNRILNSAIHFRMRKEL